MMINTNKRVWTFEKAVPDVSFDRYTAQAKDKNFIFAMYKLFNGQWRLYYEPVISDSKKEFCMAEYIRCLSFANGMADIVDRGVWCKETKTFTPAPQDAVCCDKEASE